MSLLESSRQLVSEGVRQLEGVIYRDNTPLKKIREEYKAEKERKIYLQPIGQLLVLLKSLSHLVILLLVELINFIKSALTINNQARIEGFL